MNPHFRTANPDAVGAQRSRGSGLRAKPVGDRISSVQLSARPANRASHSSPASSPQYEETLLSEITRHLASTLDYTTALAEVTRIVGERLGCGCVIDVFEPSGPAQLAHVPPRLRSVADAALEPVVAEVSRRENTVISVKQASGSRASVTAERARRKLGATWLVSAPLVVPPKAPLGTLTIFGTSDRGAQISSELVRNLGRHTAIAIENGRLYRAALAAAREREQILALVAHELKNPLGVILLSTTRAKMGAPLGGRRCTCADRELDVIYRAASRMRKLVGDLLDLSSIDAGRLSVKPAACPIDGLVHNAIRDVTASALAAGIAIIEDLSAELPPAFVDGDRIAQVLVNLLTNAIKFTPRGGRVRVRATHVDSDVVVAVEDCGRGIPPSDLEHVFDRFWQASDTAKLGTGLGLGICKSIVALSGGRIWAQSTVGVGTTFYFSVPAAS